ncbi:unnamed protein product [Peniophora sp. CBMAI 1063]|nr:unnamed protein product [Peniophora sp. CBMAI 1063]
MERYDRPLALGQKSAIARSEIAAMRFVRAHTTIPVPRPWRSWCWPWSDNYYIIMTRAPGCVLDDVWGSLEDNARDHIVKQLAPFLAQLRRLPTPYGSAICAVDGGSIYDHRLPSDHFGLFSDEQSFNAALRCFQPLEGLPPDVAVSHAIAHPIVMTHGDLAPHNMLFDRESLEITAVLDWECAGWLPSHWEYRKALWSSWGRMAETWSPRLQLFVSTFPLEAEADKQLASLFWCP